MIARTPIFFENFRNFQAFASFRQSDARFRVVIAVSADVDRRPGDQQA
jgi:hypothetical protein